MPCLFLQDTETNHMDHFLVCGESYKVLREGISRAMMEGKEERITTAIEVSKFFLYISFTYFTKFEFKGKSFKNSLEQLWKLLCSY